MTAACALGFSGAVVSARGAPGELRAVEGDWIGQVSFRSTGIPFSGSFAFASAGGELDGTFGWSSGGTQIGGVVTGPDTMPQFILTSVVSGGTPIPDVSGGGEVEYFHASCERLEGLGVNIQGGIQVTENVWWAIREGATEDPTAFFAALETLQLETNLLIDDIELGRVIIVDVYANFESAISDAEALAADLDRTVGCGLDFYRSVIAAEVERLLLFVLENPDVNVFVLAQVILASVRSSAISSGAEPFASDLEARAREVVSDRIADAIDADDVVELIILGTLAEQLGWIDAAAQARAVLEVIGE